jgi:hypothetical protein
VIHPEAPDCRFCGAQLAVAARRQVGHSAANLWLGLLLCAAVPLMAAVILGQG